MDLKYYLLIVINLITLVRNTFANNVTAGNFTLIYNPSVGENKTWYINDHTFIRDSNGTWHLFGITHAEPADPEHEILFAHATATHLSGPWTKQAYALAVNYEYFGETHLWAPHVIRVNDTYYMFYNGGGSDHTQYAISLATSRDLYNWTRLSSGPLFRDGFDARDPMIVRIDDTWYLFYCATMPVNEGNHVVAYRKSHDLLNWSERVVAFTDSSRGTYGGPTESPFLSYNNGEWYLFIGPRDGYRGTTVLRSRNATQFSFGDKVGQINAHAAKVIQENGTNWWISHCGWEQGGVYLAPLYWD